MQWEQLLSDAHYTNRDGQDRKSFRNDYDTIICSTLFRRLQDIRSHFSWRQPMI